MKVAGSIPASPTCKHFVGFSCPSVSLELSRRLFGCEVAVVSLPSKVAGVSFQAPIFAEGPRLRR